MNSEDLFWRSYLEIEQQVIKIADYTYITDEGGSNSLQSYSLVNANLLIRIVVQIETLSKKLYYDILDKMDPQRRARPIYNKSETDLRFDTDCISLINKTYHTDKKVVNIVSSQIDLTDQNRKIKPLKSSELNDKNKWQKSYQAVKHNYAKCLCTATIKNVLHACAALYLLNIYNRYKDKKDFRSLNRKTIEEMDYSFGSKLFSVDKPTMPSNPKKYNVPIPSDSPFLVCMDEPHFQVFQYEEEQRTKDGHDFIDKKIKPYEEQYKRFLSELKSKEEFPLTRYTAYFIWLFRREAPSNLPFEERKSRFLNTKEVKDYLRTNIDYVNFPNELTPENIDAKIDQLGFTLGINLELSYICPLSNDLLFNMYIEFDDTLW